MEGFLIFTVVGICLLITTCSKPTEPEDESLWTKTFGDSGDEIGWSVQQTSDGGYIITGHTASFGAGENDIWLIKTNDSGDEVWSKTFGGSSSDGGRSVQQTSDAGYIVTGFTDSYGVGGSDVWLIRIAPD